MQIICLIAGTIIALLYILLLFLSAGKYGVYVQALEEKKYIMKGIYPVGFWLLDKLHYPYNGRLDARRFKECQILYGSQYGEYYFRLNYAQKVSMMLLLVPFGLILAGIAGRKEMLLVLVLLVVCGYWYYDMVITDEMKKRQNEIHMDLAPMLSKLALLVNAGMILQNAWDTVADTGERTLYQEMQRVREERENGISQYDALQNFAMRCNDASVNKFISTLLQNMEKGNRELVYYIRLQASTSWEEKKHMARRQGEAASSRLMIPIMIMLLGILIMVLVPVFGNFSFAL